MMKHQVLIIIIKLCKSTLKETECQGQNGIAEDMGTYSETVTVDGDFLNQVSTLDSNCKRLEELLKP